MAGTGSIRTIFRDTTGFVNKAYLMLQAIHIQMSTNQVDYNTIEIAVWDLKKYQYFTGHFGRRYFPTGYHRYESPF